MGKRQRGRAAGRAAVKAVRAAANDVRRKSKPTKPKKPANGVVELRWSELSERQQRSYALWMRAQSQNGMAVEFAPDSTLWFSATDNTRAYMVVRVQRNRRGEWIIEYRCNCEDFKKHGRVDCKHIFAERLRRGEVVVADAGLRKPTTPSAVAKRRPARERKAHDGTTIRSAHRRARKAMPERIPLLLTSLKSAFDRDSRGIVIPMPQKTAGRKGAPLSTRALALVAKIARGESADGMMHEYARMIEEGSLLLRQPPCQNTLSSWLNDESLTPVLREFLRLTSLPFRVREIGCIIDSSKVSQLMVAHAAQVDYNKHDKRPEADWMKCHAICGVETLVVMAVEFSGVVGEGTHDIHFLKPLVEAALPAFPLQYVLADKAYLKEDILDWLWSLGLKAVIPLKKGWLQDKTRVYRQALIELGCWYDSNENRDFHEVYRLRSKIEALFSLLKRIADGFCWSRGRPREGGNQAQPCTAWINEVLCKFIYLNLRTTVLLEHETGYRMDYTLPDRHFPAPNEPLLKKAA